MIMLTARVPNNLFYYFQSQVEKNVKSNFRVGYAFHKKKNWNIEYCQCQPRCLQGIYCLSHLKNIDLGYLHCHNRSFARRSLKSLSILLTGPLLSIKELQNILITPWERATDLPSLLKINFMIA